MSRGLLDSMNRFGIESDSTLLGEDRARKASRHATAGSR
jgi:hypothetical protein